MKKLFMQRNKIWLILVALLIAFLWGIHVYRSATAESDADVVWVAAAPVKTAALPMTAHAIGTLVARSVQITPEIAGHVEKIFFHDGAEVAQGEPLIQLDDAIYKAKNASAAAQLVYSQNNYNRMVLLGKQGAIAKQAIDQANADLQQKKADAEESAVMLKKMTLTAPFAGVVGESKVNPGDYVTIGQSVVTLTDTQHLHLEYNVPEKLLPFLKIGQVVKITSSTYPSKVFFGKVSFISPTINTDNRSISLYAEVPNNQKVLASGMFVNATQSLGEDKRVMLVPARSLVPGIDGEQIYKIVNGKAQAVNVKLGKRVKDEVEIVAGLAIGDQIITDGQLKVKNGMTVKVKI